MTDRISVTKMACARIPTEAGDFSLCLYHNNLDQKDHLALVVGEVDQDESVLVRLHSECFTGDVLGSLRCDCGPQLLASMKMIAQEGRGVIVYLRQEGRGIGLLEKLRAYNLQDIGYDTVDANLMLGHQADLRDYRVAALILKDLGIQSLRLMTNNPDKIAGLENAGLKVTERVALQTGVNAENAVYLDTKVRRMRHLLQLNNSEVDQLVAARSNTRPTDLEKSMFNGLVDSGEPFDVQLLNPASRDDRPFITLSYAQSADGSIAARRGEPTAISGPEAMRLTHALRARHDAILVGVGTVIADDPRLSVRLVPGPDPQPIVVDSRLRFPKTAKLLRETRRRPWIITTEAADTNRQLALESAGARVIRLPQTPAGLVSLPALMDFLGRGDSHIRNVMVEGGATIITNFLAEHLVDRLVLTIAPVFLGGLNAVSTLGQANGRSHPRLSQPRYQVVGQDLVMIGDVVWS